MFLEYFEAFSVVLTRKSEVENSQILSPKPITFFQERNLKILDIFAGFHCSFVICRPKDPKTTVEGQQQPQNQIAQLQQQAISSKNVKSSRQSTAKYEKKGHKITEIILYAFGRFFCPKFSCF